VADLGERGQILLLAALFLSATFVVLALIVNSAIFAENLSTRNDVAGSQEALEYRAEVAENTGDILTYFNTNLDTNYATLRARVAGDVGNISQRSGLQQSTTGAVVSVRYRDDTKGSRIAQDNASRNLTSVNNDADWTVATDTNQTRKVQFNFSHVDEGVISPFTTPATFRMRLDNGSAAWELELQRQKTATVPQNEVDVRVTTPSGASATCVGTQPLGTSESLTIDLVEATVDGEFCRALSRQADGTPMWLGTGLDTEYDIEFDNGDAFNGTYSMVVDGTPETSNLRGNKNGDEPYFTNALYSVRLAYTYYTSAVGYETDIRVAPGEVPPFGPDTNPGSGSTGLFDSGKTAVYAGLEAVAGDGGARTPLGPSNVNALGPLDTDLTGDGSNDLPYIDSSGNLRLLESDGSTQTLVSSSHPSNPETSETLLAAGRWNGSDRSVFYVNENNDAIYRVNDSGSPTVVAMPVDGAQAVIGTGDINGDSTVELLFGDASQQVQYLEPDGTVLALSGGQSGSNNGIGAGHPPDFDGDGDVQVLVVDGSNNVKVVGDIEPTKTFTSTDAKKGPLTATDVDDDGSLEILYVDASSGNVRYVDSPFGSPTIETLRDQSGNTVTADGVLGVVS